VPGCSQAQDAWQTGASGETDCSQPSGCFVSEMRANSYGDGFAATGGGVWVTQFDVAGVLCVRLTHSSSGIMMMVFVVHFSIWFWSVCLSIAGTPVVEKLANRPHAQRADVPPSILQATSASPIDISEWGPPSASYPAVTCDIPRFFSAQQLVIDITLCGIWSVDLSF
jgi:hypothetical protein